MNKEMKINILKGIQKGEISLAALKLVPGIYRQTDRPGIYRNDTGYEIEFQDLLTLCKSISFSAQCVFIQDEESPSLIILSDLALPRIDGRTFSEIRVVNQQTAENLTKI
jgi:hypothetical protein